MNDKTKEKLPVASEPEEVPELEGMEQDKAGGDEQTEAPSLSNRERFLSRMKEKYPDVDYDDEDARYGTYNDYFDAMDSRTKELEQSDEGMRNLFSRDPRVADIMIDIAKGEDPAIAFYRAYPDYINQDLSDPDVAARLAEENKERIEKLQAEEEEKQRTGKEREDKQQAAGELISEYATENGLSDEEIGGIVSMFVTIANEGITMDVSRETLELIRKGLGYDGDVAKAREEGSIEGRNERIGREKKRFMGDGIAHISDYDRNEETPSKPLMAPSLYDAD